MTRENLRNHASTHLRTGYTTGTCAAAAARGAALMLARQEMVSEVTIDLPAGVSAKFALHGQTFSPDSASCHVIKDAGDDPDVTNGAEVHAEVSLTPHPHPNPPLEGEGAILVTGGAGIGRVTKPGLAVAPGEWAINPVPRRMIEEAMRGAFTPLPSSPNLRVTISIPDGEERAKKTLNARLGIVGGLSILGTTGIVRPISAKAWTDTLEAALDVARACGCRTVVLSTGRSSELAAQKHLNDLPEEAFIMMGDHVAYAVESCQRHGFERPLLACQFAKLLKIACGYENTHAAASELDLANLRRWAEAEGIPAPLIATIARANTAREVAIACGFEERLLELACRRAHDATSRFAPSLRAEFLVADYSGNIVIHSR